VTPLRGRKAKGQGHQDDGQSAASSDREGHQVTTCRPSQHLQRVRNIVTNALQAAKLVTNLLLCLWLPVKEFESQSILSKVRIRSAGVHELHYS